MAYGGIGGDPNKGDNQVEYSRPIPVTPWAQTDTGKAFATNQLEHDATQKTLGTGFAANQKEHDATQTQNANIWTADKKEHDATQGQLTSGFLANIGEHNATQGQLTGLGTALGTVGTNVLAGNTMNQKEHDATQAAVNTGFAANLTEHNATQGQLTGLDKTVGAGFAAGAAADAALKGQIGTGFTGVTKGLTDAAAYQKAQFDAMTGKLTNGFTAAQQQLATGVKGLSDNQGVINTGVLNNAATMKAGFTGLSGENKALGTSIGTLTGNVDTFTNAYDQDARLAQQAQADMSQQLVNGVAGVRRDIGTRADATNEQMQRGFAATQQTMGANQNQQVQAQSNFVQDLGNVRNLVANAGNSLDATTRSQYESLVASFDESGQLIRQSIDANGNFVSRELDQQGNVMQYNFDRTGAMIGQSSLNVRSLFDQAKMMQMQMGANAQMGIMTPAAQAPAPAYASPYAISRY